MGFNSEKRLDAKFRKRLRRRLHYGDMADLDAPSLPLTELAVDYFHDSSPGKLGYVDLEGASNIVRENKVTPCSMVVSVLYAKRLRQRNKQYLDTMSSSDVFFISMMMASKYIYDEGTDDEVYNDEWAVSVDQDVCDVNKMEMDFLKAMDWRLFVQPNEFEEALAAIEKRLALQEGLKRGWFTYSELDVLMGPDLIGSLWSGVGSEFSKLLVSLSAAYVTGLLSMLGSVALATQVSGPLSSATVALIALHSASPPMVSLGDGPSLLLPRLNPCGDSDGPSEFQALSSLGDGELAENLDLQDRNESSLGPVSTAQHRGLQEAKSIQGTTFTSQIPIDDEAGRVEEAEVFGQGGGGERGVGGEGFGTVVTGCEDENKQDARSCPPTRQVTSSLWSLWFLDSLLSQIWSLSSLKSRSSREKSSPLSRERGCSADVCRNDEDLESSDPVDELPSCLDESLMFSLRNDCGTTHCRIDTPCKRCLRSPVAQRGKSKKCLWKAGGNLFSNSLVCGLFSGLPEDHGSINGLPSNSQVLSTSGNPCKLCENGSTNSRLCSQHLPSVAGARSFSTMCSCRYDDELSDSVKRHVVGGMEPPGRRISNQHRDSASRGGHLYPSEDDVPTRPFFSNVPSSLFTGVNRVLQVA